MMKAEVREARDGLGVEGTVRSVGSSGVSGAFTRTLSAEGLEYW
jgi:hypothetical protein